MFLLGNQNHLTTSLFRPRQITCRPYSYLFSSKQGQRSRHWTNYSFRTWLLRCALSLTYSIPTEFQKLSQDTVFCPNCASDGMKVGTLSVLRIVDVKACICESWFWGYADRNSYVDCDIYIVYRISWAWCLSFIPQMLVYTVHHLYVEYTTWFGHITVWYIQVPIQLVHNAYMWTVNWLNSNLR